MTSPQLFTLFQIGIYTAIALIAFCAGWLVGFKCRITIKRIEIDA